MIGLRHLKSVTLLKLNVLDVEVVDMVVYDLVPIPVDQAVLDIFVDKANTVKHRAVLLVVLDTVPCC